MNSHYGPKTPSNNVLLAFNPHGSKEWKSLIELIDDNESNQNRPYYESRGIIILHDQEPFDQQLLDIYKAEKAIKYKWRTHQTREECLLQNEFATLGWPIMCHSEWNSDDIAFADTAGIITCHYFYHGLISRDWFRHWKHHGGISRTKNWQHRFLLYAKGRTGSRHYRQSLINDMKPLQSMIDYDWNQDREVSSCYSAKISIDDAQSTGIHLVAETTFDQNKIHLTEKIFKPMVMMQPFIVFAGAGSLQYLKKYGFQTFGDIWDESYDLEPDHKRRYMMLLDLTHDLCKLSDTRFNELLIKCESIVEHNHKHFFSDKFEQILLEELQSNMSISIERQNEKTKKLPGGSCLQNFDRFIHDGLELPPVRLARFKKILDYVKTTEPSRWHAISNQHPWLRDRGFI